MWWHKKSLNFETQGYRNSCKNKEISKLRKRPARATAFTRKLIAPSYDIGFTSFLA
jgi:hypothetical protein